MLSVLLLLGAFGFSWMLNKILLRYSHNFGVESRQNQENLVRWSSTIKPTTGGISFYITFLIGALVLMVLMPVEVGQSSRMLALILSATLAFMVGFADDAYGTHPGMKFLGQVLCGVILISFGFHINFFSIDNPQLIVLDYLLTIMWVVGLMNSLNMLDNMDAVTTTIATTLVMSTMIMLTWREGLSEMFFVLIVIAGAFAGFLMWNWRPAKIYMGDTGSMFIGLVVAFLGIIYFWNIPASPDNVSHIRKMVIPMIVFIVPIMDTTFVTFARLARGSSPFVGGKDHLTHQMVRIGVPEQMVPVTLGLVSVVSGLLAFFAYTLIPEWTIIHTALFTAYPILAFGIFTFIYLKGSKIAKEKALTEPAPLPQPATKTSSQAAEPVPSPTTN